MSNMDAFIINWAKEEFGIKIEAHQIERISLQLKRLKESKNITDKELIESGRNKASEIYQELVDSITVQESYFFRDKSVFLFLKQHYLPQLIFDKRQKKELEISIWSAGCCYGEEIYSIAICLYELIHDIENWSIKLFGTDINNFAITKAQKAIFSQNSIKACEQKEIDKYFIIENNRYVLSENITKNVKFQCGHLLTGVKGIKQFDIILCRNVFIYLDNDTTKNALRLFYQSLINKGLVFLGPSDLLSYIDHDFEKKMESGVFYLRKNEDKKIDQETELFCQKSVVNIIACKKNEATNINEIKKLINERNYTKALNLIDDSMIHSGEGNLLLRYKSQCLIYLGDIYTAEICLKKALNKGVTDAICYYLYGKILMDKKKVLSAISYLKLAIQKDKKLIEAYYYIAQVLVMQGNKNEGEIYLNKGLMQKENISADKKSVMREKCHQEIFDEMEKYKNYLSDNDE